MERKYADSVQDRMTADYAKAPRLTQFINTRFASVRGAAHVSSALQIMADVAQRMFGPHALALLRVVRDKDTFSNDDVDLVYKVPDNSSFLQDPLMQSLVQRYGKGNSYTKQKTFLQRWPLQVLLRNPCSGIQRV